MSSYPPKKNAAFTLYLPIVDADGDLVTGATGLSSVISGDGGAFGAGPTPVEEGEGFYSLALTAANMNFDNISGVLKTTTTGAKNTPFSIYTVSRQIDDLAFPNVSGRGIDVDATGGVEITPNQNVNLNQWVGVAPNALIAGRMDSNTQAMGTDVIGSTQIAANAIGASEFDQAAADKVWSSATRTLTAFSTALAVSVWDVLESAIVTASSIGVKVKTNLDATVSSRAPELGGNIAAIKAKTDQLIFTIANKVDASIQAAGDFAQAAADKVWSSVTRTLTALGFTLGASDIATNAIGAAQLAQDAADKIIKAVSGTADSGSSTTIVDAERTEADTDYWAGNLVLMTSGPNVGQVRRISAFNAATDTITVASAFTQPVAVGNTYIILRTSALEAPGAGATDWTAAERNQIRDALGIDGTKTAATGGDVQDIQARLPAALVAGRMDSSVGAMAPDTLTASALAADAANEIADATLDRADAVEIGLTPRQAMRLLTTAEAGKLSGAATSTITIRNAVADSKARITATVDADGNRTAITTDVS